VPDDKNNPTPRPTPSPTKGPGTTTEQDVSAADEAIGDTVPKGTSGKKGVTGVPVGTEVYVTEEQQGYEPGVTPTRTTRKVIRKTKYAVGSGMTTLLGLTSNQAKVDLLGLLSQIPGAYAKNKAYTKQQLQQLASSRLVSIRDEDAKALENVMRYADTLGITYEEAANILSTNRDLAVQFFGVKTGGKKTKVTPEQSLVAEISDKFQNTFDVPVSKKIANDYAKEVQAAQLKARGAISAQEREDIMLKYVQGAADELSKLSGQGEQYQPRGVLGTYIRQLREEYYDNGLPIDDNKIYRMAVSALRDPQELDNKRQMIRQNATLVFPPLKEYIARGESVRDILSPYMKLKADIFDIDSNNVRPSDMYDVMEGEKLKNINDYKMSLYRSPEYKKTKAYEERSISDAQGMLRYLGIG
jgi:hypothetical protein